MTVRIAVDVKNAAEIQKKLKGDYLFGKELRSELESLGNWAKGQLEQTMPAKTGAMKGSMRTIIDSRPVPLYAKIEFDPAIGSTTGFKRGYSFNVSGKYHYRSSGPVGSTTKGYIDKVKKAGQAKLRTMASKLKGIIERRWGA